MDAFGWMPNLIVYELLRQTGRLATRKHRNGNRIGVKDFFIWVYQGGEDI